MSEKNIDKKKPKKNPCLERIEQPFEREHEPEHPEARPGVHQRRTAVLDREGDGRTHQDPAHAGRPLVHETHRVSLLPQTVERPLQAGPPVQGLPLQRPPQVQGSHPQQLHRRGPQRTRRYPHHYYHIPSLSLALALDPLNMITSSICVIYLRIKL